MDPIARELVDECQAFLEGTLVERLVGDGSPIPNWAWTNLLAHGTEVQLQDPPMFGIGPRSPLWAWSQGRALLASEVLGYARSCPSLASFQTAVLVPLELDLASAGSTSQLRPWSWITLLHGRAGGRDRRTHDS